MLSLLSLLVFAHGAYPLAYQPLEAPGMPTHLGAGTSFGLLLSDDDGASWQWVCEEAIGYGPSLSPVWWISSQGALLGGTFKGLFVSTDHGCTWSSTPEFSDLPDGGPGTGVADLNGDAAALFATSGKYGVVNGIWRSTNEGADWTRLSVSSDSEFYTTARTAPSRPQRLYVGEWWFRPSPTEALYVSDDRGDTFARVDVSAKMPMVAVGIDGGTGLLRGSFYVYAVDPNAPDTLYAGVQQDDDPRHSFVLRSKDQGQSWQQLLDTSDQVTQLVLSLDGTTVWVATSGKLYRSTNSGQSFAPLDVPTKQSCVARVGMHLYACGWYEVDGFVIGRAGLSGDPFSPVLTWPRVDNVVACPPTSKVTTQCAGFLPALQAMFPSVYDGGTGGGGGSSGSGGGTGASGGGGGSAGCHCASGDASAALLVVLLLIGTRRVARHR
jgi:photosystem II stability/assembly factor-like uncharacterized protein